MERKTLFKGAIVIWIGPMAILGREIVVNSKSMGKWDLYPGIREGSMDGTFLRRSIRERGILLNQLRPLGGRPCDQVRGRTRNESQGRWELCCVYAAWALTNVTAKPGHVASTCSIPPTSPVWRPCFESPHCLSRVDLWPKGSEGVYCLLLGAM